MNIKLALTVPLLLVGLGAVSWAARPRGISLLFQSSSTSSSKLSTSQTIYSLRTTPSTAIAGQPTVITVVADVARDPSLISDGVSLIRYNSNDQPINNYGRMFDDGTHGDQVAGDSLFSLQLTFTEPASSVVYLKASAAYRGTLLRATSGLAAVPVYPPSSPEQPLFDLANALEVGDIDAALKAFVPVAGNRNRLTQMSPAGRSKYAAGLRAATLITGDDISRTYDIALQKSDGTLLHGEITLSRTASGQWLINSW